MLSVLTKGRRWDSNPRHMDTNRESNRILIPQTGQAPFSAHGLKNFVCKKHRDCANVLKLKNSDNILGRSRKSLQVELVAWAWLSIKRALADWAPLNQLFNCQLRWCLSSTLLSTTFPVKNTTLIKICFPSHLECWRENRCYTNLIVLRANSPEHPHFNLSSILAYQLASHQRSWCDAKMTALLFLSSSH